MSRLSLSLVLLATLALAACGVKGPLELPPGANAPVPNAQAGQNAPAGNDVTAPATVTQGAPGTSGGPYQGWWNWPQHQQANELKGAQAPQRPFILDGLL